jgi:hypothetical protein
MIVVVHQAESQQAYLIPTDFVLHQPDELPLHPDLPKDLCIIDSAGCTMVESAWVSQSWRSHDP